MHPLVFLLVCADFTYSKILYITPSLNVSCPQDHHHTHPCPTLSQFAAYSSSYQVNETNISLFFLPGKHSLDRELSLTYADNFLMTKNAQDYDLVIIECARQKERFYIKETTFASIKCLHFIGCGGNTVIRVDQFVIEDTIFQGVEGRGTALVLNVVFDASIVRSYFLSNTHDEDFGGALYIASSNVMIDDTKFHKNRAQFGVAIAVLDGNISISNSQFLNSNAVSDLSGFGVILLFESKGSIDNSKFMSNTATSGGVLSVHNSSLKVARSTFSDNKAYIKGGVMATYESSINITDSIFTNNIAADYNCGVFFVYTSSFNITSSSFTNNSAAEEGGVIAVSESWFNVTSSTFTNNNAAE